MEKILVSIAAIAIMIMALTSIINNILCIKKNNLEIDLKEKIKESKENPEKERDRFLKDALVITNPFEDIKDENKEPIREVVIEKGRGNPKENVVEV